jgi:hypothetical protein
MARTPFEDLVHRINNLLGTIEIQAEVARIDGTLEGHEEALRTIVASAQKTHEEVRALVAAARHSG